MSWEGKAPCSAGSCVLLQQGVWEAHVLYSGEGLLGPVPQGVTSVLRMQLSLEIKILSCPKLRLFHPSPLMSLLCLSQHLLGFEQHLR